MLMTLIVLTHLALAQAGQAPRNEPGLLFSEGFEDTALTKRGWYDGDDRFTLSDDAAVGQQSIQYHFPRGKLTPSDSSGVRHPVEPTEVVYLRFHLKLSPGWSWTIEMRRRASRLNRRLLPTLGRPTMATVRDMAGVPLGDRLCAGLASKNRPAPPPGGIFVFIPAGEWFQFRLRCSPA